MEQILLQGKTSLSDLKSDPVGADCTLVFNNEEEPRTS
jgi:hypothetical protein